MFFLFLPRIERIDTNGFFYFRHHGDFTFFNKFYDALLEF